MALPDGPFIFVSYVREDSDFVFPEIERLEKQGYRIWYDKEKLQPGDFWDSAISRAIDACACFIVFITQDSINSRNVRKEIDRALSAGKHVISIHWEKVTLPPEYDGPIGSRQALERYSLLKREYEEPLNRALAPYRIPGFKAPAPPQPETRLHVLPKILFFTLVLLAVFFLWFAAAFAIVPFFPSALPDDLLNKRQLSLAASVLSLIIACGMGVAAFVVYWAYLRRKHG